MFGTLTKERITQLQTEIKQINPLITFVKKVEELEIPSLLVKLNQAKTPSTEIIAIFAKVGEKLSTDSGILPLPNDITYVKSLFQNIEHAILTVQEKEKALSYIAEIEKQVANLYQVKEKIQDFVRNLSNQISVTGNTLLTTKIAPLQQKLFMNTSTEKTSLITKMTNNFEVIIPNIRGCLGCMQKECNNPHNLAF
ncbi:MAG: hypothetical protein LBO09_03825 [Candidatus Peribacteria bacterium]|jgi:hypothetical protein|nr:hypothetical protein [Candidatus Peribacteria bacterium]